MLKLKLTWIQIADIKLALLSLYVRAETLEHKLLLEAHKTDFIILFDSLERNWKSKPYTINFSALQCYAFVLLFVDSVIPRNCYLTIQSVIAEIDQASKQPKQILTT